MKRSTLVISITIFLSIAIGGVLGFYFYLNSKSSQLDTFGREIVTGGGFGSASLNTSVTLPGNSSSTKPTQTPVIQQKATSTPAEIPKLRHIYALPVSGMSLFTKDVYATSSAITETIVVANGTSTATSTRVIKPQQNRLIGKIDVIQFADRATGHIYETSSTTLALTKVSNTTVTKTQEALFSTRDSLILRDLVDDSDIIRTRFGLLKYLSATSSIPTLRLSELPFNMTQATLSPNKSKIFYTLRYSTAGTISNVDGSNSVVVFDLPYKEWLLQWPTEKTVVITSKPSAFADGFAYKIDINTKTIQKIIGGQKGLTTLVSPDGNKVVFSASDGNSPNLYIYDMGTRETSNLYFRTLPEKCVWSPNEKDVLYCTVPEDLSIGDYPDVWYQGRIFFNDSLWKINLRTNETRLLANLNRLAGQSIDAINPTITPSGDYMIFQNKFDLSLWGLTLIEASTASSSAPTATSTRR